MGAKAAIAALVSGLALAGGVACAETKDCAGLFYFDPNPKLSLHEAVAFGESTSVDAGDSFTLIAATTFWEDVPWRGKWKALAIVYSSMIGAGTEPIGGVLWTTDRSSFGSWGGGETRRSRDAAYLTFKPVDPIPGCAAGFTFKLDKKGVLWANGTRIGVTPTLP